MIVAGLIQQLWSIIIPLRCCFPFVPCIIKRILCIHTISSKILIDPMECIDGCIAVNLQSILANIAPGPIVRRQDSNVFVSCVTMKCSNACYIESTLYYQFICHSQNMGDLRKTNRRALQMKFCGDSFTSATHQNEKTNAYEIKECHCFMHLWNLDVNTTQN